MKYSHFLIFMSIWKSGSTTSLFPQSEKCCKSLLVTSPSLTLTDQPDKLGQYSHIGAMNGRRVYKHDRKLIWLYYYDWNGQGANWMFGDNPGSQSRGIESINLQGRSLAAQWCPEDLHKAKVGHHQSFWSKILFDCEYDLSKKHA